MKASYLKLLWNLLMIAFCCLLNPQMTLAQFDSPKFNNNQKPIIENIIVFNTSVDIFGNTVESISKDNPEGAETGEEVEDNTNTNNEDILTNNGSIDNKNLLNQGKVVEVEPLIADIQKINLYDTFVEAVKVYPNPTTNILNVNVLDGTALLTIKLHNIIGQTLYQRIHENNNMIVLEVGDYPKGIYLLELNNGKESVTHKINIK